MIGAILGGMTSLGGALFNNSDKYIKQAKEELDRQEKNAENAYGYALGKNRADVQAALSRSQEQISKGLESANNVKNVIGGNSAEIAAMKGQVIESAAESGRRGAEKVAEANAQALNTLTSTKNSISQARASLLGQQAQQSAAASSQLIGAGLNLATADMEAHLDKGKGLFESMFKKKSVGGNTNG